jgi:hypothetical protein
MISFGTIATAAAAAGQWQSGFAWQTIKKVHKKEDKGSAAAWGIMSTPA